MLKNSLIGALIALGMLLPPILHFITGPLGPLVGGYTAGFRTGATSSKAIQIGLAMGLFMVAPIVIIVVGLDSFGSGLLSQRVQQALGLIGGVVLVYTAVMGGVGAIIGGHMARKQTASEERAIDRS